MDNLQAGQTLGPYRILRQAGQGGMATVYQAYHAAMDRDVAVKVLPRQLAESAEFLARFQQEARVIARLEHPHILPVHDYGESEGIPYLVMRYLDAGTLKERLLNGPLALAETDRLFSQLADALEYAHAAGVVHRDLKPSNVLVDARGNVFLTDFGIAKLLAGNAGLTTTGALIGTPAYMSPEQAQGLPVDTRTDVYSLGIILYEMVTGRVPFEAETPLAVVLKHLNDPLPLPSTLNPAVPPAVERVILKALAKSPDERFAATSEFLTAWKAALAEAPTAVRPAPEAVPTPIPAPAPAPTPAPAPRRGLSLGLLLTGFGGLAVMALAVLFGLRLLRGARATAQATRTATVASVLAPSPAPTSSGALPNATPTAAPATPGPVSAESAWTSWTADNFVVGVQVAGDRLLSWGAGGLSVWNLADGVREQHLTPADGLPHPFVNAVLVDEEDRAFWIGTDDGLVLYQSGVQSLYTTDDGLDSNYIAALAWTDRGLMIGTQYSGAEGAGLMVFDGERWRPVPGFPSADSDQQPDSLSYNVTALAQNEAGVLCAGTTNGLGCFDGQGWRRFSTAEGLPSNEITALYFGDGGALWVGTSNGAARWTGERFEPVERLAERGGYGIVQDDEGRFWFSGGGGVARFDPGRGDWEFFSTDTGDLRAWTARGSARDAKGNLYFATEGGGIARVTDAASNRPRFESWLVPNVPQNRGFSHIVPAPDGRLWFVHEWGWLADWLDPASGQWTPEAGRPCEYCVPLAFDAAGQLWAGGELGAWRLAGKDVLHLTSAQGLPSDVVFAAAFGADGTTWLGTAGGLAAFDGQSVRETFTAESAGFAADSVRSLLAASDGSLWVGTQGGLSRRLPDGAWEHFAIGQPFGDGLDYVADLAEDAQGALWAATFGDGVYRYTGGEWTRFGEQLPSDGVYAVAPAPDGSVWAGLYYHGAARFDGQTWTRHGLRDGLIHPNVNDIYVDPSGAVWFAASGGVTRFQPSP